MERYFYRLAEEDYAALAAEVKSKLRTPCYFTGVVEALNVNGDVMRLTATLILYRRHVSDPTEYDAHDTIYDVQSVWWDFYLEDEEGIVEEDFDFEKFREFLIEE
jgi:hypothetical protein